MNGIPHPENFIRMLDQRDIPAYNKLINDAFTRVPEFQVERRTLCWTPTDDHYYVLGLFKNRQLVAFLRLEWIESIAEFKFKIDEDVMPFSPVFPMGYLAKAGTSETEKNQGFNSLLRYHALKMFLELKVSSVLGVIAEGSARHRTMEKIGYHFFEKHKPWNGNFKSNRKIVMGLLQDRNEIILACERLEELLSLNLIQSYPLIAESQPMSLQGRTKMIFPWSKKSA